MEELKSFGAAMLVVFFTIGSIIFFVNVVIGIVKFARRNEKSSEFVGGIVHSMLRDSQSWDYDANENWLISDRAALSISLQVSNFGCVCTRHAVNSGSNNILKGLEGADRRAFCKALAEWRDKTAIDRQHRIERWKRDSLAAMAA
jgi:hypothetical protein